MEDENNRLFREKSIDKATGPEQLDRYLKVTSMSSWIVVAAEALVVAAIFLWAFAGKIQTVSNGAGVCRNGKLLVYFPQSETEEIKVGDMIRVNNEKEFKVCNVNTDIIREQDVPGNVSILIAPISFITEEERK